MSRIRAINPRVANAEYQEGPTLFGIAVTHAEEFLRSKGFFEALGEAGLTLDKLVVKLPFDENHLAEDYRALEKIGELLGQAILDEARKQPGFALSPTEVPLGLTLQMDLGADQKGVAWGPGYFEVDGQRYERFAGAKNEDAGTLKIDRSSNKGKVTWNFTGHRADLDPDVHGEDALIELSTMPNHFDSASGRELHLFHVHRVYGSSELPKGIIRAVMAQMVKSEGLQMTTDYSTMEKSETPFDAIEGYVANKPTFKLLTQATEEYGGAENIPQAVFEETKLGKMRAAYAAMLGYEVDRHEWNPVELKLLTFLKKG